MVKKKVAVCILNFNGHQDTIECIDSILEVEGLQNITIMVLDNGSKIDSLKALRNYFMLIDKKTSHLIADVTLEEFKQIKPMDYEIILVESDENYGFAGGNNKLIEVTLNNPYEYVLLLNNDTKLIQNTITHVQNILENTSDYDVATTNVVYYAKPDVTWNAGGRIYLGNRKYFSTNFVNSKLRSGMNIIPCTFISGCFMMIRANVLKTHGVLTEKFFFGEEDYEFALRMKANKIKMCSVLNHKVYHKVNATIKNYEDNDLTLRRALCTNLNRFVNMKFYYGANKWWLWRLLSSFYIFCSMTLRGKKHPLRTFKYLRVLNKLAIDYDVVDKKMFFRILNGEFI